MLAYRTLDGAKVERETREAPMIGQNSIDSLSPLLQVGKQGKIVRGR